MDEKAKKERYHAEGFEVALFSRAFFAEVAVLILNEGRVSQALVANGASEASLVELERILALVALVDHEVFRSGSDGFAAIRHRTSLRESLNVTVRAERRSVLNAEPTFSKRLIAALAEKAISMEGVSSVTHAALGTNDGLLAFCTFRRDVTRVALVAILFELILGIVDEAFRSSNVVTANRASEAIRMELPPLVFQQVHCTLNRLIAPHASSYRHLERRCKKSKKAWKKTPILN